MIWEDECYLLSKKKFRENANIINIFTQKKGKLDGIVYGGTSRKVRNYLQISNKLFRYEEGKKLCLKGEKSKKNFKIFISIIQTIFLDKTIIFVLSLANLDSFSKLDVGLA